ncbi:MAG: FHA domain-containing protein [Planctomycetota bacterium]
MKEWIEKAYLWNLPQGKLEITRERSYTIGRQEDVDIVLKNSGVSRAHARILWEAGQFLIKDLQSSNGTFVNKKRVKISALNNGDTIIVGPFEIIFKSVDPDAAVHQPPPMKEIEATVALPVDLIGTGAALRGDIKNTKLYEVIQFMKSNMKSGTIRVVSPSGTGNIHFIGGDIIHAEFPAATGIEAVKLLLSLEEGTFELVSVEQPKCERTIHVNTISLLLDLMRQQDEVGK